MRRAHGVYSFSLALLLVAFAAGCSRAVDPDPGGDPPAPTPRSARLLPSPPPAGDLPTATPTPPPTPTPIPPAPSPGPTFTPTPTPPPWEPLAPGVSQRYVPVERPGAPGPSYLYALRIEPQYVTFRVHYDPQQPRSIEEWQAVTGASVVVNGGFFSGANRPVGRIIVDGELFGAPLYPYRYGDDSVSIPGLFAVVDETVALYALGRSTYNPRGLRFDQAVESYPVLLLPGRQPSYPTETGREARRTVIAMDEGGNVIILVSDLPLFSLYELARWLAASDLGLDIALNLDGGRSSGLAVAVPGRSDLIPAYVPLPIVIAVYSRGG